MIKEPVSLTWKQWEEQYKVIPNTEERANPVFGKELEFVKSQDPRKVWTWVRGDNGDTLVNGFTDKNANLYYICEKLWDESKDYEVVINIKVECQCFDPDKYDTGTYGYENCFECEGTGYTREWMSEE